MLIVWVSGLEYIYISDEVTKSPEWRNMDDGSQCFFYQSFVLYGTKSNDTGMGNDNDENVDGDDTDMLSI